MKKLPLGIQNFRKIIEGDYVYVDKTQYVYDLINSESYYFLSRPRRFGKSLLLDTIGEVFNGEKELFKGLWIYGSDYDFEKYPMIRLDMSSISNETPEILKKSLISGLRNRIKEEGLEIDDEIPSDLFKHLISSLYKKYNQRVVVLIDEYDKPILDHINDVEIAEANRMVIRGFYGILKSMDKYLRFTFITGVSKFTKTSIFSELNNLLDITFTKKFANICGITIEDFDAYFREYIKYIASLEEFDIYEDVRDEILAWYDGYSWDGKTKVINPFSLLSFFSQERFAAFWYASGTPKFLIELIKKQPEAYTNLKNFKMTEYMLDSVDIDRITISSLLFQTGYLTVKEIPPIADEPVYILDIPNNEVRRAFSLHVLSALTESNAEKAGHARMDVNDALRTGDLPKMLDILRGLFASIPYELHVDSEAYYHSIFYAVMNILGFDIDAEVSVSGGRVDAVMELGDKVYIIEFKYKNCPPGASEEKKQKLFAKALGEGMDQIKDRGYYKKYIGSGKTIYQAAFAFLGRDEIEMTMEME